MAQVTTKKHAELAVRLWSNRMQPNQKNKKQKPGIKTHPEQVNQIYGFEHQTIGPAGLDDLTMGVDWPPHWQE